MKGEQLYALYAAVFAFEGRDSLPWESLTFSERASWGRLAAQLTWMGAHV